MSTAFFDLTGMATNRRVIGAQLDLLGIGVLIALIRCGHILRDINHNRTGTTGSSDVVCLADYLRDFLGVTNAQIVLNHRTGNTDHIGFLEGILTNKGGCNLAAQNHHGDGIHERGGNAGNSVGGSRTRGHQYGTWFSGCTGIAVGHVDRRLFVPHQNMLDFVLPEQRIINMKGCTTRIAVYVFDPFILQGADQHIGARQ